MNLRAVPPLALGPHHRGDDINGVSGVKSSEAVKARNEDAESPR